MGRLTNGTLQEFLIPSRFFYPQAIIASPDGYLWIAGQGGIGRVSPSGSMVLYSVPDKDSIRDIAPGPGNAIWFTDPAAGKIKSIRLGARDKTLSAFRPDQITPGRNGDLWFTMIDGDGVARINPAGKVEHFSLPGTAPVGIVVDRAGSVWVSDWIGHSIVKLIPGGATARYPIPTKKGGPSGITVGPDGHIWFAESLANKIGRLQLAPERPVPGPFRTPRKPTA